MTQTAERESERKGSSQSPKGPCIAYLKGLQEDQKEPFLKKVNAFLKKKTGLVVDITSPLHGKFKCLYIPSGTVDEVRNVLEQVEHMRQLLPEGATLEVTQV